MTSPFLSSSTPPKNSKGIVKKHFLISMALLGVVILASTEANRFVTHGPRNALEGARASLDNPALEREYAKLIASDFFNLENHRGYLDAHLATPKVQHTRHSTITRNDNGILNQYNGYISSADPAVRDIGLYGMGYFCTRQKEADKALDCLGKIANKNLPYVNNSLGYIFLWDKHRPDLASDYFYREIAIKGNVKGAVSNLAQLFWDGRKLKEMEALSRDADLGQYFPIHYLRYLE